MAGTKKMLIVTDVTGKIVAAAHLNQGLQSNMNTGIMPLPGQKIHEIDVPEELTGLNSGHTFHLALSQAKFMPGSGKIQFKPVNWKKVKH